MVYLCNAAMRYTIILSKQYRCVLGTNYLTKIFCKQHSKFENSRQYFFTPRTKSSDVLFPDKMAWTIQSRRTINVTQPHYIDVLGDNIFIFTQYCVNYNCFIKSATNFTILNVTLVSNLLGAYRTGARLVEYIIHDFCGADIKPPPDLTHCISTMRFSGAIGLITT